MLPKAGSKYVQSSQSLSEARHRHSSHPRNRLCILTIVFSLFILLLRAIPHLTKHTVPTMSLPNPRCSIQRLYFMTRRLVSACLGRPLCSRLPDRDIANHPVALFILIGLIGGFAAAVGANGADGRRDGQGYGSAVSQ